METKHVKFAEIHNLASPEIVFYDMLIFWIFLTHFVKK